MKLSSKMKGMLLKSASGWYKNGNGTDQLRFSAFPAGGRDTMHAYFENNYDGSNEKICSSSVRCVEDN